jgi:hypothetical protein
MSPEEINEMAPLNTCNQSDLGIKECVKIQQLEKSRDWPYFSGRKIWRIW